MTFVTNHSLCSTYIFTEFVYDQGQSGRDKCVLHHGMARPRVTDRGTVSNVEGSCKYTVLNKQSRTAD